MFPKLKGWFAPKPLVPLEKPVSVTQPSGPKKYFEYFVEEKNGVFEWLARAYIPHPVEVIGIAATRAKARHDAHASGADMIKDK